MKVLLTTEGTYPFHWGGPRPGATRSCRNCRTSTSRCLRSAKTPTQRRDSSARTTSRASGRSRSGASGARGRSTGGRPGRSTAGGAGRARPRSQNDSCPHTSASSASCSGTSGTTRRWRRLCTRSTASRSSTTSTRRPLRGGMERLHGPRFTPLSEHRAGPRLQRDVAHARRAVGGGPVDLSLALPALAADRGGRHRARDDGRRLLDGRRRCQARARRRFPALGARHLPAGVLPRRGRFRWEPVRQGAEARFRPADHRARVLAGGRDRALLRLQPSLGTADRRGSRAHPHRVLRRRPGSVPAVRARAGRCTRRRVGGQDRSAEGRRDAAASRGGRDRSPAGRALPALRCGAARERGLPRALYGAVRRARARGQRELRGLLVEHPRGVRAREPRRALEHLGGVSVLDARGHALRESGRRDGSRRRGRADHRGLRSRGEAAGSGRARRRDPGRARRHGRLPGALVGGEGTCGEPLRNRALPGDAPRDLRAVLGSRPAHAEPMATDAESEVPALQLEMELANA